jgi:hypothetical protein
LGRRSASCTKEYVVVGDLPGDGCSRRVIHHHEFVYGSRESNSRESIDLALTATLYQDSRSRGRAWDKFNHGFYLGMAVMFDAVAADTAPKGRTMSSRATRKEVLGKAYIDA